MPIKPYNPGLSELSFRAQPAQCVNNTSTVFTPACIDTPTSPKTVNNPWERNLFLVVCSAIIATKLISMYVGSTKKNYAEKEIQTDLVIPNINEMATQTDPAQHEEKATSCASSTTTRSSGNNSPVVVSLIEPSLFATAKTPSTERKTPSAAAETTGWKLWPFGR